MLEKHAEFLEVPLSHLFRNGSLSYAKKLVSEKEKLLNEKL
jgi:hypothetical protein